MKQLLKFAIFSLSFFGLIFTAYPFFASWKPNAKSTEFLPIEFDISKIPLGSYEIIEVFEHPVMIYRPNNVAKNYLISINDVANGPDYSLDTIPEFFIYEPLSTHLGCVLWDTKVEKVDWYGYDGLYDLGHRGFWDYAGRLIPSVNAGQGLDNLKVVQYQTVSNSVIRVKLSSI